jgi:hypothetical protein
VATIPEKDALKVGMFMARAEAAKARADLLVRQHADEMVVAQNNLISAQAIIRLSGYDPELVGVETLGTPNVPVGTVLNLDGTPAPDPTQQ